ncbi:MAG: polyphosphate kinase 1 [Marinifilum sp.]|jgi:polyphosphate kinase|nr:polyphosphate kinase 1 [Marinifilum sp.]
MSKYQFLNRDLSWLSFNKRVLEVATNPDLPLYERIKFLAIYSSNLDEFYRVRVGTYKRFTELPPEDKQNLRENPDKILRNINTEVDKQQIQFGDIFRNTIIPELKRNNIILVQDELLCDEHHQFVKDFFLENILPHAQPMLLLKQQIKPFLQNNSIYLAVKLFKRRGKKDDDSQKKQRARYAIIKVPCHHFPRFIELPEIDGKHYIMFLDDIVKLRMKVLFPGYKIASSFSFKLSRDADLLIEDEYSGDLIDMIERSLKKRETGSPSRFLYDESIPKEFLRFLKDSFDLLPNDMVKGGRYHNFQDFFGFPNPKYPDLELKPYHPLSVEELKGGTKSIFKTIRKKDRILHFPYQSYKYVIRFLNEAALDPKVEEIKATQYRVADNSAVVNALINAAHNGKKVTVFVEVKARFDEEANLRSAREMRKAGIKIIYSIPGLKVHAKIALIIRKDDKRDYAFLSTGNFNEKTAKIYADHGFLTSDKIMIQEMKQLFDYLENQTPGYEFKKLLIGQFNLKSELIRLIDQEIENAKNGKKAYILLKMNGLQEREMIKKLYEASESGVKIDLILRGICCLKPDQKYSKNIRIIRIVDQFLEHARAFYFHNNGEELLYLSSADWMNRNLQRRIECAFPIHDIDIKNEIIHILKLQLADNVSARYLNGNLDNVLVKRLDGEPKVRSQIAIAEFLKDKEKAHKEKESVNE